MTSRNPTLDIAKGLGILLVVLGHSGLALAEKGMLFRVIFSFHMPLFFVLAGVFVRESAPVGPFLKGRAATLLKPYVVVLGLWGLWCLVEWILIHGQVHPIHVGFLLGMGYGTGASLAPWTPLWFLPHLFLSSATLLGLLKVTRAWPTWPLAATDLLLLGGGAALLPLAAHPLPFHLPAHGPMVGLPWSLDLLPVTLALLLAGHLLSDRIQTFRFRLLPFLFSAAVFTGLHHAFPEAMDLSDRVYGGFIPSTLKAATGIHLCLSLADLLRRVQPFGAALAYTGRGSLLVLVFHGWCQGMAFYLLARRTGPTLPIHLFALAAGVLVPLGLYALAKHSRVLTGLLLPSGRRTPPPSPVSAPEASPAPPDS